MPKSTNEIKKKIQKEEKKKQDILNNKVQKKSTSKKIEDKTTTVKKKKATNSNKKTTSNKVTTKVEKAKKIVVKKEPISVVEYYDLPYRYNQTIVKVLAQTPNTLFVYWDISDEDRKQYSKQYGDNFFDRTKPVLIIHNETMNYTYEIEINDFANSWYLHVNDPDCKYFIELGRRPIKKEVQQYIAITSSNYIDAPNNHVLFNSINPGGKITFKNTKTKKIENKEFKNISLIPGMEKIYDIYSLYQTLYPEEWNEIKQAKINNPSSSGISSFK